MQRKWTDFQQGRQQKADSELPQVLRSFPDHRHTQGSDAQSRRTLLVTQKTNTHRLPRGVLTVFRGIGMAA
jgi:hypothetical protein